MAPYFLVMAGSMLVYPRYLLPALLPALAILAARAANSIRSTHARTIVLASVCMYSLAFAGSQVARFPSNQQHAVARWVRDAAGGRASHGVRVGVPHMILDDDRLTGLFAVAGMESHPARRRSLVRFPVGFRRLPEWYEIAIEREMRGSPVSSDLEKLQSGAAGYERGAAWSSRYLQQDFYTALDPAFAGTCGRVRSGSPFTPVGMPSAPDWRPACPDRLRQPESVGLRALTDSTPPR